MDQSEIREWMDQSEIREWMDQSEIREWMDQYLTIQEHGLASQQYRPNERINMHGLIPVTHSKTNLKHFDFTRLCFPLTRASVDCIADTIPQLSCVNYIYYSHIATYTCVYTLTHVRTGKIPLGRHLVATYRGKLQMAFTLLWNA